jgi:Spy/CpxP family protein refolding chaperone
MMADRIRQRLQKALDLTPEQMAKISPIIDKEAGQLEQVRQETAQRVHGIITDAHQQIATNLTDEQRTKLKDLETRIRQRHERRRDSRRWHSSDAGTSQ